MLAPETIDLIDKIVPDMIAFRRELHMNPELGFQEFETTKSIINKLAEYGLEASSFDNVTGCMIRLGASGENAIALRADIDALPLQDMKDCEYKSRNDGQMHACGHDVHTTILLGALVVLSKLNLDRSVVGIFQPAEEVGDGARALINEGVLRDIKEIIGLHVEPLLPVGSFSIRPGPQCACVIEFDLEFKGQSAHGARPHLGNDAVLSACQFVNQCYSFVHRRIDAREPHVITFGAINGGSRANIVSESCSLKATIRAFNTDTGEKVLEEVKKIAEGIALMHEVQFDLNIVLKLPAVVNDKAVADKLASAVAAGLGADSVKTDFPASLGGEDFGAYLEHVPGAMFRLGVASGDNKAPALHSQNFDIDEEAIVLGIKAMVASSLKLLES